MSEDTPHAPRRGKDDFDKKFAPSGTLFLMTLYILVIALAWGSVYFGELLARR